MEIWCVIFNYRIASKMCKPFALFDFIEIAGDGVTGLQIALAVDKVQQLERYG